METNKSKRKNKHRISMDMPDHLFEIVKKICEDREMTITKYVLGSVVRRIRLETDHKI